jgi:hypothetical protein
VCYLKHNIEQPGQLEIYAQVLEELGCKSSSTEAVANDALNYLYNRLSEGDDGPCALIRFFRTMSFDELTPALKDRVKSQLDETHQEKTVNCLTLLASKGIEPAWNDRFASKNHQVIPLVSERMVANAPMVAQLIARLGIDVAQILQPAPHLFLNPREKNYNVLYVPEALGDGTIVSQSEFVLPYKIRSVIGLGGLLPTGDMFAVMIFMRILVSSETAMRFKMLARGLEIAINALRSGKKNSARILVAADHNTGSRLQKLLGEEHEVVAVTTIAAAINSAQTQIFDLVICGISFDESRMFDLLKSFKRTKSQRAKPFICYRQGEYELGANIESGVATAARIIGANCYLDATQMSDEDLLTELQAYLPEEIWASKH